MVRSLDAMISLTAEQKVFKELGDKIYLGQMVGKEVSPGHFFTRSQGCLASLQIGKRHRLKIVQIIFSILKNVYAMEKNAFTPSTCKAEAGGSL